MKGACGMLGVLALVASSAAMYDVVVDYYAPPANCTEGCASWTDLAADNCTGLNQSAVDAKWQFGVAPANVGRHCAMPANDPGEYGAWCYCRNSMAVWGFCEANQSVPTPEQVNLQVAGPDTVVVSFVTFNDTATSAPTAQLGESADLTDAITLTGITKEYTETSNASRHYFMHFVVFPDLTPSRSYFFRVRGGARSTWSSTFNFTSLYSGEQKNETKFAIFGDMGVYTYNNMDWLLDDVKAQRIDFIVHLGDHAYNVAQDSGLRGDGYFNAFQPILTKIPWVPVLGNHEYYDGDEFNRFLNQTYGVTLGDIPPAHPTSHINSYIAIGSTLAQAVKGTSKTSRYYSVDVGQVHVISLDLNVYYFDTELVFRKPMLDWLRADLEAASQNRATVPWIIVNAHQPLYCSSVTMGENSSSLWEFWYDQSNGENPGTFRGCTGTGIFPVEVSRLDLEALFREFDVDLFFAGHEHDYESIYAVMNGTVVNKCDAGSTTPGNCTFTNPSGVVHFVTGAGGAPHLDKFGDAGPFTRIQLSAWGYGRVTATQEEFVYEHVLNSNGTVFDRVTVRKAH
ncbi:uncharacterized protein MONBRDRAFT_33725 [Monosiga brevicollis MX1]|uniref:Purple acid phosphatase n=1 Tax=Monosiga brevicollis TaxID=81824 RepID=A9V737_MONBE|nr:uncharacterized protein MONBRDRAFT_33725 [Monosiga brevicollis MX1]EDQ86651.1 predicted protein [Monosiga brevicollis MX1]|eukprot:XP_001748487.1 hypothetical protein [Monosiga brevicollis MX1]